MTTLASPGMPRICRSFPSVPISVRVPGTRVIGRPPSRSDIEAVCRAGTRITDRLPPLYVQVMAELALIAEKVEAALD